MIPESFIQELLQRIDIVDLIDGYVPLKKAGANYAACCPFHNEKSPSFTVSPTKQFYHCFGCGAHGTAIGFVMEYSGQGFVDTIKELSSRVGLLVPEQEGRSRDERQGTVALIEVMALASKYYREQLKHSSKAIDYLKRRGLTGEIAARFAIGYAPDGWQNLEAVFPNYSATELQAAGLVIKNEQGRLYDRFRDRVMFPIISQKGEVIAFGGRVLDAGEPKYLNSPETPLFEKGRELFGLPQARQCLRDKNVAVVVEGYMDVVALAQHGVNNALATLGTATTPTHIQKLFRQVDRVVFCFDGDAAGRKAAWRALENSLEALADDKTIGFVLLPAAEDPDSYVRAHGAGAFETLVLQATPLSDFLLRELAQQCDMTTAEGKARLVHEAKPLLTRLKTPLLRLQLVKRLAEASGFSQTEVERLCELKSFTAPAPRRVPRQKLSLARTVIRLILQKPELAMRLPAELVSDATAEGAALRYLCQTIGGEENLSTVVLLERLRGGEHEALMQGAAAELLQQPFAEEEIEAEFCGAVAQFELELINQRLEDFKRRAGALSAEEKQEYVQLLQQKGRWHRSSIPD